MRKPDGPGSTATRIVAGHVRRFREQRGWSAQRLAEECALHGSGSLTRSTIAKIESGVRKSVTTDEVAALARAFRVAPSELFEETETPERDRDDEPPAEHLETILGAGTRRHYRHYEQIFDEGTVGDWVALINRGHVKATTTAVNGYVSLLAVRGPGELIGEGAALDRRPRSATVTAVTDVDLTVISADRFRELMESSARLAVWVAQVIAKRLEEANRRQLEFGAYDAVTRVERILLELALNYGRQVPGQPRAVVVPILHRELAGAAGASRESAVRALRLLQERGLVQTRRGHVVVTDIDQLAKHVRI